MILGFVIWSDDVVAKHSDSNATLSKPQYQSVHNCYLHFHYSSTYWYLKRTIYRDLMCVCLGPYRISHLKPVPQHLLMSECTGKSTIRQISRALHKVGVEAAKRLHQPRVTYLDLSKKLQGHRVPSSVRISIMILDNAILTLCCPR
jgi:hypothetical protein